MVVDGLRTAGLPWSSAAFLERCVLSDWRWPSTGFDAEGAGSSGALCFPDWWEASGKEKAPTARAEAGRILKSPFRKKHTTNLRTLLDKTAVPGFYPKFFRIHPVNDNLFFTCFLPDFSSVRLFRAFPSTCKSAAKSVNYGRGLFSGFLRGVLASL